MTCEQSSDFLNRTVTRNFYAQRWFEQIIGDESKILYLDSFDSLVEGGSPIKHPHLVKVSNVPQVHRILIGGNHLMGKEREFRINKFRE